MYEIVNISILPITTHPSLEILSHDKKIKIPQEMIEQLQQNSHNDFLMYSIICYIQWLIYNQSLQQNKDVISMIPNIHLLFKFKKNQDIKKGVYGFVKKAYLLNNYPVILKFIKKNIQPLIGIYDILHEYLIAIHSTNVLRKYCPNYCMTFGIFYNKNNITMAMEYINGVHFSTIFKDVHSKSYTTSYGIKFLKLIIQLIGAIELGQDLFFFTHYDLHLENVMIQSNHSIKDLYYPFKSFSIHIENPEYICNIIDYGFSSITIDNKIYGKNNINLFPELGMYPFFITGIDLIKFFSSCYYQLHKKINKTSCNYVFYNFISFVLTKFYNLKLEETDLLDNKLIATNFSNQIYKSPTEFILFLYQEETQKYIYQLFKIDSYPFHFLNEYKTNKFEISNDVCPLFHQIFQQKISSLSFPTQKINSTTHISNIDVEKLNIILHSYSNKTPPILHLDHIMYLYDHYKDIELLHIYCQSIETIWNAFKSNTILPESILHFYNTNLFKIIQIYYVFKSVLFYLLYIKTTLKLSF